MPVHKTSKGKYKWGKSGKEYDTKAAAEKQARAIYANGYRGDGPKQEFDEPEVTYISIYGGNRV